MDIGNKQQSRETVLETLGLAKLVDTSTMDIDLPHHALVERQAVDRKSVV